MINYILNAGDHDGFRALEWKQLLLPGPVTLHPDVQLSQALPMINHRGTEFRELMRQVISKLRKIYGCDCDIALLTASGTGAIEAMLINFLAPNEKLLVVQTGVFSDRMAKIAKTLGMEVELIEPKEGEGITPEELDSVMKRVKPDAVGVVANETSTGVAHKNLEELAKVVHSNDAIILVDAVSYLGGHELHMDSMDLDAVASATQKALMSPPGLSFVAYRERAAQRLQEVPRRSVYWDFLSYKKFYDEKHETPATPAVSTMFALNKALDIILEIGLSNWINRHRAFAEALNFAIERSGGKVYPHPNWRSNTIVVPYVPEGMTPAMVKNLAKEKWGLEIGSGGWKIKEKTVRIGTMGWYGRNVVYRAIRMIVDIYGGEKSVAEEAFDYYLSLL
ncbi:hypothetical protein IPA_04465 [Ignicoccus pacificus DSM 13166]|uniref:Aminotransferase class V domain-containing protein n=1 Tax=Ignicoccus pacificus DSM 13166 TaxID=940294 RepID=A0A977PLE3_9CREN|nr:hypothetical protein IPA_04465 [Ignicoccus pacificus DSM 13166]